MRRLAIVHRVLALAASLGLVLLAAPPASAAPMCFGQAATIVGTNGRDVINGTAGPDVIVARDGRDEVHARGGNDRCGWETASTTPSAWPASTA
jgi:Ca2+-binding RTX toxin-like protein